MPVKEQSVAKFNSLMNQKDKLADKGVCLSVFGGKT